MPREADFYTPGEAARLLGLAERTILGLLTSGQLEGHQDERARWWIPFGAIEAAQRSREADYIEAAQGSSKASNSTDLSAEQTIPMEAMSSADTIEPPARKEPDQLEADAETTRRTQSTDNEGQSASKSGWTTTTQSARTLGVSPRTVRRLIDRGELEGRKVTEGIVETWEVSIDSLYVLRNKRISEGQVRGNVLRKSGQSQPTTDVPADYVRDLTDRLLRLSSEVGELRGRLELTVKAESTLQEERDRLVGELEREREERREAREEAEKLRTELEAERSKGFWRRLFGS
jgi:regulator of replication initiation timing